MSLEDKMLGKETRTAVVIPDLHIPYHDERAVDLVIKYIKDIKPAAIYQIGDFYDFYSVSKFDKDPKRIDSLQEELDKGTKIWRRIKKAGPKDMKIHYLQGNHEFRLEKYLWKHPELHSLRVLKLDKLLDLDSIGIKYYKNKDICYVNKNLIVTHGAKDDGCKLSQHSGYSAKNTLEKTGISGVSGHSHRLASHYKRTLAKQLEWHEAGCLCDINPDYTKLPNWQQGFARIKYNKTSFDIKVVSIKKGYTCIVDGKRYKA